MEILYDDAERDIFCWTDNRGKKHWHDPMQVQRRINKALATDNLNQLWKNATLEAPPGQELSPAAIALQDDATQRLVEVSYAAFNLTPVDEQTGEGVPAATVLQALNHFYWWLAGEKKSTPTSPDSVTPSQDTSAASESPVTPPASDSTSTEPPVSTSMPPPPPSAPQ